MERLSRREFLAASAAAGLGLTMAGPLGAAPFKTTLHKAMYIGDAKEDTLVHAPGAQVVRGEWKGGRLEVQRPGARGAKVTQIITLEDEGKSLVIRTRMESSGSMPARDLKRVYRRTES